MTAKFGNLLDGKVVIITGGAGLIGNVFVEAVTEQGGIAIIADSDKTRGIALVRELRSKFKNDRVDSILLDITSTSSMNQMIDLVKGKYGRIDALVNCAYPRNVNYGRLFEEVTYKDFCENVNLHLGGFFLACQRTGIFFKQQGYGNIINVASIYGVIAPRFEIYEGTTMTMPVEYAAIKSAIIHLTRYMAKYFKGCNIRVNSISPGGILDGQEVSFVNKYSAHCLTKGLLDKSDLKGVLVFLLSDMSHYISGQNLIIDDGFAL